jgi:hypothetical protein
MVSEPRIANTSDSLEHKLYNVGSLIFAYGKEQWVLVSNPFDEIDRKRLTKYMPYEVINLQGSHHAHPFGPRMTGCQETPYATGRELHPARRYPGSAALRQRSRDRRAELPQAPVGRGVGRRAFGDYH